MGDREQGLSMLTVPVTPSGDTNPIYMGKLMSVKAEDPAGRSWGVEIYGPQSFAVLLVLHSLPR